MSFVIRMSLSCSSASSSLCLLPISIFFFFFNDTAPTEIYTLSLHDALPIFAFAGLGVELAGRLVAEQKLRPLSECPDRKSTRLNSSHLGISYAVFCLKKKKKKKIILETH